MPLDSYTNGPYLGTSRNPYSYEKVEQISRDISTEWLSLTQITDQLNLFGDTSQDTYLQGLELATRMAIEDFLGMAIFATRYKVYYGAFNGMSGGAVNLDLPEVTQSTPTTLSGVTINSVGYWDTSTPPVFNVVDPSTYFYDPTGNKVIVNSIPNEINQNITNPIVVDYTQGANPLADYPVIQQAGLLLLTHLYNNRSNTTTTKLAEIPFGVAMLLRPYKPLVM
jgi:hypothetical protein